MEDFFKAWKALQTAEDAKKARKRYIVSTFKKIVPSEHKQYKTSNVYTFLFN